MNYFAHGRLYTDEPYFLAGTAVPDLLRAVDRRVRVRSRAASSLTGDGDPRTAAVARGILQHLLDDQWFHRTRAFFELSWQLAGTIRDLLPRDDGLRPRLVGHILVELLLDATLIEEDPERLEAYYRAMDTIDGHVVQAAVNRMAARRTDRLATMLERFSQIRFLSDYPGDDRLLSRLNQIMRRIGLPPLPEQLLDALAESRRLVAVRKAELLAGEPAAVDGRTRPS